MAEQPETNLTVDQAIARVVREEFARLSVRQRRVMTREEAAQYLGCVEGTIDNLVALGRLKACRFDRRPRFDVEDLDRLIEASKNGAF